MRAWFIQNCSSAPKRFRIPIWWEWVMNIPQPRWLKRLYYRKSYEWWNHPSNHHWKGWCFGANRYCDGYKPKNRFYKWLDSKCSLISGERDIWGGSYCELNKEKQNNLDKSQNSP